MSFRSVEESKQLNMRAAGPSHAAPLFNEQPRKKRVGTGMTKTDGGCRYRMFCTKKREERAKQSPARASQPPPRVLAQIRQPRHFALRCSLVSFGPFRSFLVGESDIALELLDDRRVLLLAKKCGSGETGEELEEDITSESGSEPVLKLSRPRARNGFFLRRARVACGVGDMESKEPTSKLPGPCGWDGFFRESPVTSGVRKKQLLLLTELKLEVTLCSSPLTIDPSIPIPLVAPTVGTFRACATNGDGGGVDETSLKDERIRCWGIFRVVSKMNGDLGGGVSCPSKRSDVAS